MRSLILFSGFFCLWTMPPLVFSQTQAQKGPGRPPPLYSLVLKRKSVPGGAEDLEGGAGYERCRA